MTRGKEKKEPAKMVGTGMQNGACGKSVKSSPQNSSKAKEKQKEVAIKLGKYARETPRNVNTCATPETTQETEEISNINVTLSDVSIESAERENALSGNQTEAEQVKEMMEPTLKDIFLAINKCNASISSLVEQVQGIRVEITLLRQDIHKIKERVDALEERVSILDDIVTPMQEELRDIRKKMAANSLKLEDIENRSRRKNIRLVGIPEHVEGMNPVAFAEEWLAKTVGRDLLSSSYMIERAYRIPARPLPEGSYPRAFLIRLGNYRDKETILRKVREIGDIYIAGARIMFFPDFSQEVQKKRIQFVEIKRRLRQLGLSYSMMYPARLRVVKNNATPQDARAWLDRN